MVEDGDAVTDTVCPQRYAYSKQWGTSSLYSYLEIKHPLQCGGIKSQSSRSAAGKEVIAAKAAAMSAANGPLGQAFAASIKKRTPMSAEQRAKCNESAVLMSIVDMRPCIFMNGLGWSVFAAQICPAYAQQIMCNKAYDKISIKLEQDTMSQVVEKLKAQYETLGQSGPFCSLQVKSLLATIMRIVLR